MKLKLQKYQVIDYFAFRLRSLVKELLKLQAVMGVQFDERSSRKERRISVGGQFGERSSFAVQRQNVVLFIERVQATGELRIEMIFGSVRRQLSTAQLFVQLQVLHLLGQFAEYVPHVTDRTGRKRFHPALAGRL